MLAQNTKSTDHQQAGRRGKASCHFSDIGLLGISDRLCKDKGPLWPNAGQRGHADKILRHHKFGRRPDQTYPSSPCAIGRSCVLKAYPRLCAAAFVAGDHVFFQITRGTLFKPVTMTQPHSAEHLPLIMALAAAHHRGGPSPFGAPFRALWGRFRLDDGAVETYPCHHAGLPALGAATRCAGYLWLSPHPGFTSRCGHLIFKGLALTVSRGRAVVPFPISPRSHRLFAVLVPFTFFRSLSTSGPHHRRLVTALSSISTSERRGSMPMAWRPEPQSLPRPQRVDAGAFLTFPLLART